MKEKGVPEVVQDKEAFIDMTSDSFKQVAFKEKSVVLFWMETKAEYPQPSFEIPNSFSFLFPFVKANFLNLFILKK